MEMVTISVNEFRELVEKAVRHDIKRKELLEASYVSPSDRILFNVPEKCEGTVAEDDNF